MNKEETNYGIFQPATGFLKGDPVNSGLIGIYGLNLIFFKLK